MIKLTKDQIKDIAGELICGMNCYYNKKTEGIIKIPDIDNQIGDIDEVWKRDLKRVEDNQSDFVEFEMMDSRESFLVMEYFTDSVDDPELREELINALNRPKPFSNFKWIVDNSGDYRQRWFDFRDKKYIEWVEDRIDRYNSMEDSENK